VRWQFASQHAEQRRLAGTVPAEQTDSLSCIQAQRDAVEQGRLSKRQRDVVEFEKRHRYLTGRGGAARTPPTWRWTAVAPRAAKPAHHSDPAARTPHPCQAVVADAAPARGRPALHARDAPPCASRARRVRA